MNSNLELCDVTNRIAFFCYLFWDFGQDKVVGVAVVLLPLKAAPNSETIHLKIPFFSLAAPKLESVGGS